MAHLPCFQNTAIYEEDTTLCTAIIKFIRIMHNPSTVALEPIKIIDIIDKEYDEPVFDVWNRILSNLGYSIFALLIYSHKVKDFQVFMKERNKLNFTVILATNIITNTKNSTF